MNPIVTSALTSPIPSPGMNTASYHTPALRTHFYHSLTASTVPVLTATEAATFLLQPFTPNTFFPSCPITAARSIALTNSFFYVKDSLTVPRQQGLFLRRSIARQKTRLFVGFYTGWLHHRTSLAPFEDTPQTGTYSLEILTDSVITPTDSTLSTNTFNSKLSLRARTNGYGTHQKICFPLTQAVAAGCTVQMASP